MRPTGAKMAADLEAINSLRNEFVAAHNANNASDLSRLYAHNAVLMPPNEQSITGRQAIKSWLQATFTRFNAEILVASKEVRVAEGLAFDRWKYTIRLKPKSGGESIQDSGKALLILQKQADESWEITHDIWSSDK